MTYLQQELDQLRAENAQLVQAQPDQQDPKGKGKGKGERGGNMIKLAKLLVLLERQQTRRAESLAQVYIDDAPESLRQQLTRERDR